MHFDSQPDGELVMLDTYKVIGSTSEVFDKDLGLTPEQQSYIDLYSIIFKASEIYLGNHLRE